MPAAPPSPELSWSGWGDPAQAAPLPAALRALLRETLGIRRQTPVPAGLQAVGLEPIRLPRATRAKLAAIVGDDLARSDHPARVRHALASRLWTCSHSAAAGRCPLPIWC